MTREQLKSMGLTDEQIETVMTEHGKTVNTIKQDLEAVTTDRDSLKEHLTERDTQLNDLSGKVKDNDELTAEIERLKGENSTATTELQEKLDKQAFDFSLDKALSGAKVRNSKAVRALLDTEKIKLDGDKLLNLDDQLGALKESDAYLFESAEEEKPKPNFSTGQHGTGAGITTADFSKMTYSERLKMKQDNPKEYETLTGK